MEWIGVQGYIDGRSEGGRRERVSIKNFNDELVKVKEQKISEGDG